MTARLSRLTLHSVALVKQTKRLFKVSYQTYNLLANPSYHTCFGSLVLSSKGFLSIPAGVAVVVRLLSPTARLASMVCKAIDIFGAKRELCVEELSLCYESITVLSSKNKLVTLWFREDSFLISNYDCKVC